MKKIRSYLRYQTLAVCALVIMTGIPAHAASPAANYPNKPIRLVVAFPPGGGSDTLARIIAPKLAHSMGQQWVVDNRSGAGGNIASEVAIKAPPDGYTVLMGFNTALTVNPALYKNLNFNIIRDLQPITQLAQAQYVMVLHPSVSAASVKEFIELAKTRRGGFNYSSAGIGTAPHLAGELFKYRAGVNMVHVPYKGGGPASVAVLGGEVQVMFASVPSCMDQVKAGRLRALATTGLKRLKVAPDIPTLDKSGFPGFSVTNWYGFLVPAKTPEAIVNRLQREAVAAVNTPEVLDAMAKQGLEPTTNNPAEFEALIKSETQTWAEVVKAANIQPE